MFNFMFNENNIPSDSEIRIRLLIRKDEAIFRCDITLNVNENEQEKKAHLIDGNPNCVIDTK